MSQSTVQCEHGPEGRADLSCSPAERALRVVLGTLGDLEAQLATAADRRPSASTVRLLAEAAVEELSPRGRVDFLVCLEKAQAWLTSPPAPSTLCWPWHWVPCCPRGPTAAAPPRAADPG